MGSLANQGPISLCPGSLSFLLEKSYCQKSTAFLTSKNSKAHHQELLGPFSRNVFRSSETQEPRKGDFVTPKKTEIPKDIGPSSSFGTQSTIAKRGIHTFLQKPPSNRESSKRVTCKGGGGFDAKGSIEPFRRL